MVHGSQWTLSESIHKWTLLAGPRQKAEKQQPSWNQLKHGKAQGPTPSARALISKSLSKGST